MSGFEGVARGFKLITLALLPAVAVIGSLLPYFQQARAGDRAARIGWVDQRRLDAATRDPDDWLTGGRDQQQAYFSPLKDVDTGNVARLGFAWQYDTATDLGFESTPLVVDGRMYATGPRGVVYVLDAATGAAIWTFTPPIDPAFIRRACCGQSNRGLAVWKGKVYVGALDGYLYALDAATGQIAWKVDTFVDRGRGYTITGAPYVAGDSIVVGNGGADLDARGYVSSYDATTGRLRWRFFTVPHDPKLGPQESMELEQALPTWSRRSRWDAGLGGTAWDGMAYDPALGLLYVGVGNGGPHPAWLRSPGGGDNLYLSSIVALDARTGRMVWHYQTTPADSWDFTATQKIVLADLAIGRRVRKVLMQAPKNGLFYVIDRVTGALISATPYTPITWASGVDPRTGRPIPTGQGDYSGGPKLLFPGALGAHLWQPMAFNPATGLVYLPSFQLPTVYVMNPSYAAKTAALNVGATEIFTATDIWPKASGGMPGLPALSFLAKGGPEPVVRSTLKAWDPVNRRVAWEMDTSGPWTGKLFAAFAGGGTMTTAGGLVFQGRGDGNLAAIDARSGRELAKIFVGTSLSAAPMTYRVGGVQYVAIMAGINPGYSAAIGSASYERGNGGRIVAFRIGGGAVPLPPRITHAAALAEPPIARPTDAAQIAVGGNLFRQNCSVCHRNVDGAGVPNLLKLSAAEHQRFDDVVLHGILAEKGMGNFSGLLTVDQVRAIHAFLIDQGWAEHERESNQPRLHEPAQ